jgi:hypothetical protein
MAYRRGPGRRRYKRSYNFRRRFRKNSSAMALRLPRKSYQQKLSEKTYTFKRTTQLATIANNGAADTIGTYVFRLNDLINPGNFAFLGDVYKIACVVLRCYPQSNVNATGTGVYMGEFYHAIDINDSAPPASAADIREYQCCRTQNTFDPFKVVIYPQNATPVYRGNFTTAYITTKGWVSTSYQDVEYYGWKYAWTAAANATAATYIIVTADYYIKVRSIK